MITDQIRIELTTIKKSNHKSKYVFLCYITNIACKKESPRLRIKQTQMTCSDRQILVASPSYKVNVLIKKLHLKCVTDVFIQMKNDPSSPKAMLISIRLEKVYSSAFGAG